MRPTTVVSKQNDEAKNALYGYQDSLISINRVHSKGVSGSLRNQLRQDSNQKYNEKTTSEVVIENKINKIPDKIDREKATDLVEENQNLLQKQSKLENRLDHIQTDLQDMQKSNIRFHHEHELLKEKSLGKLKKYDDTNLNVLDLKNENKKLKEQLKIFVNNNKQSKKLYKVQAQKKENTNRNRGLVQQQNEEQVKDLLKLIDYYKQQLKDKEIYQANFQQQMQSQLQGSKMLITDKQTKSQNNKLIQFQSQNEELQIHNSKLMAQNQQMKDQNSKLTFDLQNQEDKNLQLETSNRAYEIQNKMMNDISFENEELKRENEKLENKLMSFTNNALFTGQGDKINDQQQIFELKQNNKTLQSNYDKTKQDNIQKTEEIKIRTQNLQEQIQESDKLYKELSQLKVQVQKQNQHMAPFLELGDQQDDQYFNALGTLKLQQQNPQQLKANDEYRKEIEKLKIEKTELAQFLHKSESLLQIKTETEKYQAQKYEAEFQRLNLELETYKSRCTELSMKQDQFNYQQKIDNKEAANIIHNDSVFSTDQSQVLIGELDNYLDLWVGKCIFTEENISNVTNGLVKKEDIDKVHTFITIDFFNHQTQNTEVFSGKCPYYNYQVAFRVEIDEFLLNFLSEGYIKIEVYAAIGLEPLKICEGEIPLRNLLVLSNDKGTISSQVNLLCSRQNNQQVCLLNYRMRFRRNIYEQIRDNQMKMNYLTIQQEVNEKTNINNEEKKLIFKIQNGNFVNSQNSFIYYNLQGDHFTDTKVGSHVDYQYSQEHPIILNNEMIDFLRHTPIDLVIFKDSDDQEILGECKVSLQGLLEQQIINETLIIKSNEQVIGKIQIKIYWYTEEQVEIKDTMLVSNIFDEISLKLSKRLREKKLQLKTSFMVFNRNQDGYLGKEEFILTIRQTLNMDMDVKQLEWYYSKLEQPCDYPAFCKVFKPYLSQVGDIQPLEDLDYNRQRQEIEKERDLKETEHVKDKIQLLFVSKCKNGWKPYQIMKEIDVDESGTISAKEMQIYLLKNGISPKDDKLVSKLLRECDADGNGTINIKEFLNMFLNQENNKYMNDFDRNEKRNSSILSSDVNRNVSQKNRSQIQQSKEVNEISQHIYNYMRREQLTFKQLLKMIDQSNNGVISQDELYNFIRNKIGYNCSQKDVNSLMKLIDTNDNNKIDTKEFCQYLQSQYTGKSQEHINDDYYYNNQLNTVDQIVNRIIEYMLREKIQTSDLWKIIDKNNNSSISRIELKNFLTSINVETTKDQFDEFFYFFDQDRNGSIQIDELVDKITERKMRAEKKSHSTIENVSQNDQERIQQSVQQFIIDNQKILEDQFTAYSVKEEIGQKGQFCKKGDFIEIINNWKIPLNQRDVCILADNIVMHNFDGSMLNWHSFMGLALNKYNQMNMSQIQEKQAKQKQEEFLSRLAKVIKQKEFCRKDNSKKYVFDENKLFAIFDLNNNGTLDQQEFNECLTNMKLDYTKSDIDMIFYILDQDKDNQISLKEFMNNLRQYF